MNKLCTEPSLMGANGTFNYLIKLITDVPETRAMYFRRLRTIMDTFLNGWVRGRLTVPCPDCFDRSCLQVCCLLFRAGKISRDHNAQCNCKKLLEG